MAPDRLRDQLNTLPFRPFNLELASGKCVPVKHPDYAFLSPAGRTLTVYGERDKWMELIDVFLITSISFGRAKAVRRK